MNETDCLKCEFLISMFLETVILYAISEFYKFIGYHISPKSKEYINVLSMHCVHSYMLMSIKGLFVAPEIYLPLLYSC